MEAPRRLSHSNFSTPLDNATSFTDPIICVPSEANYG